jgi:hypothetical protein
VRFKANLIHPDDAPLGGDGEDELPGDLALLGAQLRDDAERLAMCYGPTHAAVHTTTSKTNSQPQLSGAPQAADELHLRPATGDMPAVGGPIVGVTLTRRNTALYGALALALLSSAGTVAVLSFVPQREPRVDAIATERDRQAGVAEDAPQSKSAEKLGQISPSSGYELSPAAFLLEASEPEMEALLDLREHMAPRRTKISI